MNIAEIQRELKTQDNLATAEPIYVVQEEVTIYGLDLNYCDDYLYLHCDGFEYKDEQALIDDELSVDDDCIEKTGYRREWRDITCCFTRKGAENYIKINGHNHKKTRIYVKSLRRNWEMIEIRNLLLSCKC